MRFQGLWVSLVLSVKAKLFNLGLNKLRVATSVGGTVAATTATTTAPEAALQVSLVGPWLLCLFVLVAI